jgi:hypothetical protein
MLLEQLFPGGTELIIQEEAHKLTSIPEFTKAVLRRISPSNGAMGVFQRLTNNSDTPFTLDTSVKEAYRAIKQKKPRSR